MAYHVVATSFDLKLVQNMECSYLLQPKDQTSRTRPTLSDSDSATTCFESKEFRVPRLKIGGKIRGVDLLDDMHIVLCRAGNTVLEAVTFRKAGSSTPWVRIRRTTWEGKEISPGPSAVYEISVADIDKTRGHAVTKSLESVCCLIHRESDEAWSHIERRILRAGVGAKDTWRDGWSRPAAPTAQDGNRITPPATPRKPRTLPWLT